MPVYILSAALKSKRLFCLVCFLNILTEVLNVFFVRTTERARAVHPQNMFQQQNISSLWAGQQALNPCTEKWKSWVKHEKDGPKMNVFCFQRRDKVYRPFFFDAETVAKHLLVLANGIFKQKAQVVCTIFFFFVCGKPCHSSVRYAISTKWKICA